MTKRNADTVRNVFHLFASGQDEDALTLYHEDVVVEASGNVVGGTYRGRDGLMELAARVAARLPGEPRFDLVNVIECGNTVVAEIKGSTVLSSGREERWRTAEIFELRDGKVAEVRLYTDTEALAWLAGFHAGDGES